MQSIAQHIAAASGLAGATAARRRTRVAAVNVLCNDGRNGLFTGRAEAIEFDFPSARPGGEGLRVSMVSPGITVKVDSARMKLCIHRVWVPFVGEREWYGNWCWNRYLLRRPRALQLLHLLCRSGHWDLDEADSRFASWWSRHQRRTGGH